MSELTGYPKWIIKIWFQASATGEKFELAEMILKTKRMTMKKAQEIAVREAEKCWPHYLINLEIEV